MENEIKTQGTYIRFERGRDGITGPTFGPFDWVQMTYETLRVSPDGKPLATFLNHKGDWLFDYIIGSDLEKMVVSVTDEDQRYSDIIIYGNHEPVVMKDDYAKK